MAKRALRETISLIEQGIRRLRHLVFESDDLDLLSSFHRLSVSSFRYLIVLGRETAANQIWQRASALTYTTILSLFPLLMVLSSAASVFYTEEEEERLIGWVTQQFTPQSPPTFNGLIGTEGGGRRLMDLLPDSLVGPDEEEAVEGDPEEEDEAPSEPLPAAEDFARTIQKWGGDYRSVAGGLGFAGVLGLFIVSLLLYKSIEQAFEAAWETSHISSFSRTVTGFTFLVVVAPIILGLSITLSSFVVSIIGGGDSSPPPSDAAAEVTNGVLSEAIDDGPTGLRRYLLMLVPAIFNSIILSAAYMYIPKAKVQLHFALLGGFIAGFLWEAAKLSFFAYIYFSTMQRALFQSLGLLPIFLIWIYFTWLVFLVGNQIVYVSQNYRRLRLHHFGQKSRTYLDGRLLVAITLLVADSFERGHGGIRHEKLGMLLRVPPREFDRAMAILLENQLIELTDDGRYTMHKPPDRVYVEALLNLGCDPTAVCARRGLLEHPTVLLALEELQEQILDLGRNRTLREMLASHEANGEEVTTQGTELAETANQGGNT